MTKSLSMLRGLAAAAVLFTGTAMASGGAQMESAQVDINDKGALQRGAALYMNYCSSCHSLTFLRYSRMAADLGLTEEQVRQNLMFQDANFGDPINTGLDPAQAAAWFGKAPPDLSLIARRKAEGPDWVYNYLKSFYIDESRPMGWNNSVFPGASMPNVLWQMQGSQHALTEPKHEGAVCAKGEFRGGCITGFSIPEHKQGSMSPEQFDRVARDITTFLAYAGEPAAAKREAMGVWVVLFLAFFTLLAYFLKKEYWRDVH
jgi:ubiquinol-cytochrome c reductase cytochrome c1 subunit